MTTETDIDEVIEPGLPPEEELQRLRRSQKSILAKSHERKARIAELETENAALKTKADAAEAKAHEAVVGVPLRNFAEQISEVPTLWLSEFNKRFKVESKDGKLAVLHSDGTPVLRDGEPIPFTPNAIWTLLTGGATNYGKDENSRIFAAITRWQGATGSGASPSNRGGGMNTPVSARKDEPQSEPQTFGLR
jgi:hypothetical protein